MVDMSAKDHSSVFRILAGKFISHQQKEFESVDMILGLGLVVEISLNLNHIEVR